MLNLKNKVEGSLLDELQKNVSKSEKFVIPFNAESTFKAILKASFMDFKGANWRNYEKYPAGSIFKSKTENLKYEITSLEKNQAYEVKVIIGQTTYWMGYFLSESKNGKKTQVTYEQKVYLEKFIGGFRRTIAKMNFAKSFEKKTKAIAKQIYEIAKVMNNEN